METVPEESLDKTKSLTIKINPTEQTSAGDKSPVPKSATT